MSVKCEIPIYNPPASLRRKGVRETQGGRFEKLWVEGGRLAPYPARLHYWSSAAHGKGPVSCLCFVAWNKTQHLSGFGFLPCWLSVSPTLDRNSSAHVVVHVCPCGAEEDLAPVSCVIGGFVTRVYLFPVVGREITS